MESNSWADWAAVVVASVAALLALWSATSAAKQNKVSTHSRMIEVYQDYMHAFQAALFPKGSDFEVSEMTMRMKSATDVLEFYFKPIVYTKAQHSMDDFILLWNAVNDWNTYRENKRGIYNSDYEEQCAREAIDDELKKIRILRKKLRGDHELCINEMRNELRLHQPSMIFRLRSYIEKIINKFR